MIPNWPTRGRYQAIMRRQSITVGKPREFFFPPNS
jgi:hypothetical protein